MNIVNPPDEHNALDAWTKACLSFASNLRERKRGSYKGAAVGAAVVAGMAAVTVSVWLKLILDGVTEGDSSLVTLAAAAWSSPGGGSH